MKITPKERKHREFLKIWAHTADANSLRVAIMRRCFVSRNVYYDWLSGRTEIPQPCLNIIKTIYDEQMNTLL